MGNGSYNNCKEIDIGFDLQCQFCPLCSKYFALKYFNFFLDLSRYIIDYQSYPLKMGRLAVRFDDDLARARMTRSGI